MIPTDGAHLDDAELLATVLGEAIAGRSAHLAGCPACADRRDRLAAQDAEVSALLAVLDHPMPLAVPGVLRRRRSLRRGFLVAASAVGTLAIAAAALVPSSPLHRWIAPAPTAVASAVSPPRSAPAPRPTGGTGIQPGIAVQPAGEMLVVFRRDPGSGALEIDRSTTPEIGFRSSGGRTGYRVDADRIEIDNREPAATYLIDVPAGLHHLVVKDRTRVLLRWPDDSARWAVPGAPGRVRMPLDREAEHGP